MRRPHVSTFGLHVSRSQEEYQKYMERVRGKAQNAIDQANTQYQHQRTMLTARVDALVHFLQQRHVQAQVRFPCAPPAPSNDPARRCCADIVPLRSCLAGDQLS